MYKYKLSVGFVGLGLSKLFMYNSLCEYDKKLMSSLNSKTIKGSEFKKLFPKYQPVMFMEKQLKDVPYKIGLNKAYENNGEYFADPDEINTCNCGEHHEGTVAIVDLLDDEDIHIRDAKCKTNLFVITEIIEVNEYLKKTTKNKFEVVITNNNIAERSKTLDDLFELSSDELDDLFDGYSDHSLDDYFD
jgi:hypothetical protein